MQISPIQQNNTNFTALKKVQCLRQKHGYHCTSRERLVISELEELAKENNFFKNNDIKALISIERYSGTKIVLKSKPTAKTLKDRIKNLFVSPQYYFISDTHPCPDDSSFYVAKKLREVKNGNKDFSTIFTI